jgi:two-component system, LytTR family, sensor kinase
MKKWVNITLHIVFWFYMFAWQDIIGQLLFNRNSQFKLSDLVQPITVSHYILFPLIFYCNYLLVMPKYYKRNKIKQAWVGWVLLLIAFILMRYLVQEILFMKWFGFTNYFTGTTLGFYFYDNMYYGGVLIVMSVLLWMINDNAKVQKEKYSLLEEKKEAQLSFLKNQVNPHFIFNTLNNIYSLVSNDQSGKALKSIEKLSELMRYMYKDSDNEKVSLQQEIDYINSFIDLQSIRLNNEAIVQYKLSGNITNQTIAPLLLISFIENMFKHGILNQPNKPLCISITVEDHQLILATSNYINPYAKDTASGIGLENVKKRLALLYPNQHTLNIKKTELLYECLLELKLNK